MSSVSTSGSGAPKSSFSFGRIWDQYGMLVVFAVLFIACAIFVPNFATFINMKGLGLAISMSGMVACGMLFCLASGDFDLSVASVIACAGVTTAVVINLTESLWIGVAAGLLLGILCMVGIQPVYAAGQLLAFLPEGQDCYYLNGTLVTTGEQQWHTFNYAGHTYFPIRTISELFGFQVQWQPDTQTIRLSDEERVIVLTVDSHIAMVNQQEQAIDIAPIIQEGRSLIPLRTLAQLTDSYVLYKDGVIYYAETPISKAEQQQDWFRQIYTDLQANHSALSTEPYNIIYEDGEAIPLVSLYKDNQVEYLSQQFPYGIDKLFWRTDHQELHTVSIPNLTQVIGIWQPFIFRLLPL